MKTDELAPPVENVAAPEDEPQRPQDDLEWELNRLRDFKKGNVKRNNQTLCPACATHVSIKANKCPQCSSDIAANNALVRESLRRLEEVTAELDAIRDEHMERIHGAPTRPFSERLQAFFFDPQTREDMKIVLPSLVLFFVGVATLRVLGNQMLFWTFSIAGGVIAYSLFSRLGVKRLVTIDLYRSVLVFGLLALLASSVAQPTSWWSGAAPKRVEVLPSTVNIRTASTTQSAVLTTAHRGDKLVVIERRNDWYKINTKDGQEGWVYASLVRD
jgi:hypothetical protein